MSLKEKINNNMKNAYLKKYGDRITNVQGNVISVTIERKKVLWIFNKLRVMVLVRPDRSKAIVKCVYVKSRFLKSPQFMNLSKGNLVIIQGLKGKKGKNDRELVSIVNIKNLTTKKDLFVVKGQPEMKKVRQVMKYK